MYNLKTLEDLLPGGKNISPDLLRNIFISETDNPDTIADKFTNLAKRLGLNHEQNILLRGERSDSITESSLKHALLESAQSPDTNISTAQMETVLKLLGEITGLQLLNIAGQQDAKESTLFLGNWFFSSQDEELLPLFLKVKKYNQGFGDVDESTAFQILFFIVTRNLGEVICRLSLGTEHLSCGFTAIGKKEKEIIDRNLNSLKEKLESLPWKIVLHRTKVNSPENIRSIVQKEFFEVSPDRGSVKTLDVRI